MMVFIHVGAIDSLTVRLRRRMRSIRKTRSTFSSRSVEATILGSRLGDCRSIGWFAHHNSKDDEEANHERRVNVGRV